MIFVGSPGHRGGVSWAWTGEVDFMNHWCVDFLRIYLRTLSLPFSGQFKSLHVFTHIYPFTHLLCNSCALSLVWIISSANPIFLLIPHHLVTWCISLYVQAKRNAERRIDVKVMKDSWRPCLRIAWNHEPHQDASENMSNHLKLCLHEGNELPKVRFMHSMFQTSLMCFALSFILVDCHFLQSGFSTRSCFSWLKCAFIFSPPVLVNFVQAYNAWGGILCFSIQKVDWWQYFSRGCLIKMMHKPPGQKDSRVWCLIKSNSKLPTFRLSKPRIAQ